MNKKSNTPANKAGRFAGVGVLSAVAASLCCITPVLALFSGASGVASTFSWMEPARPYLIGITVLVLGFAWYQKLKPRTKEEIECACEDDEKPTFWQTKKFLGMVTVFALIMMAFPYYSKVFYPDNQKEVVIVNAADIVTLDLEIEGMTCESCNLHVEHAAQDINGVYESKADFKTGQAKVTFDTSKTSQDSIVKSINSTGYKVIESVEK
ncbi:MAG: mercuric transport protein MerTP [Mariniphaga sp.]